MTSHDLRSEQERVDDMKDSSDLVRVSQRPNTSIPCSRQMFLDAGRPLGDVTGYEEHNHDLLEEECSLFSSKRDCNVARWFVQGKVAKTQIDNYVDKGFGSMEGRSFRSACLLEKQPETLNPFREYLSSTEATLESGEQSTTFYYAILYPRFTTSSGRMLTKNIWFTH